MLRVLILLFFSIISSGAWAEEVVYEIYEITNIGERLLVKGKRTYSVEDIQISPYERGGKKISEKYLLLEEGYRIGARIFRAEKLSGFGLLANRGSGDFSWEWYNRAFGNHYKKLQGETSVYVTLFGQPFFEELAEVHFLEDTTLRFIADRKGMDDTHKIVVKAGSVLRLR